MSDYDRAIHIKQVTKSLDDILPLQDKGYGADGNLTREEALAAINQYISEIIGEDEPVVSQHYYAGNIEERTAFPARRNQLRAEQRKAAGITAKGDV